MTKVRGAHEVDYEIFGHEMQFVEVELDPGETAIAEAGVMMHMDAGIQMDSILGDGSSKTSGVMGKLIGVGKRMLTGESLFMSTFTNQGGGKKRVGFSAPYPGKIVPLDLSKLGGTILCQKEAFICAARGVAVGIGFQKRIGAMMFGGEGFILQKLEGDGMAFVHAGGTIVERELAAGQTIYIDTGCLVALAPTVDFDIHMIRGIKSMFFGGEGFFLTKLTGPGHVWLQSLPFSRVSAVITQHILDALPENKG